MSEFNKSIIKLQKLTLLAAIQFETLKHRHFFFFLTDDWIRNTYCLFPGFNSRKGGLEKVANLYFFFKLESE